MSTKKYTKDDFVQDGRDIYLKTDDGNLQIFARGISIDDYLSSQELLSSLDEP